jgi:hypothetical protein
MPKAVTMWEFSWLLRRSGEQNEYADVDRILDELVERGYDCVRIDAFPHLIATDENGDRASTFRMHPQPDHFMWGHHGSTIAIENPLDALVDFIRKCRSRSVTVALSSWFTDDDSHRKNQIRTPQNLVRVWAETMAALSEHDVLDAIEYVDLCNEFPLDDWLPAAYSEIFGRTEGELPSIPGQAVEGGWVWTPEQRGRVEEYLAATIPLRSVMPQIPFTVSFAPVSDSLFDLSLADLDLVETHIWLSSNVAEFAAATNFSLDEHGFPAAWQMQVDSLDEVYWPDPPFWHRALETEMRRWAEHAAANGKPLWTTEGWSHILLDDFVSPNGNRAWDYVKSVAESIVPIAIDLGWEGICTSNFCEPHFPGVWSDVEWHQRMTSLIKAGRSRPDVGPTP